MDNNLTQMTQVVGNSETTTCKGKRARKWIMTLNNYTLDEVDKIECYLKKNCDKWIFGFEVGEQGTPHLQGYMEFKSARSLDALRKVCARWHLENARGSLKQNYDYTSKDGNYRYGGFNPEKIAWTCCIKHLYLWQEKVINIIKEKPDERSIHWFYEDKGCSGKTTLQKHIFCNFKGVIVLSGKANDMKNGIVEYVKKNGEVPDIILINIPRTNLEYLSYTGLEEVKDMFFYSGKYEGAMVCGPCPHVICFANQGPDVHKCSADRWKITYIEHD